MTSLRHNCYVNIFMTSLDRSMADSVCHAQSFFSVTLQTEILSTETLDFLKRIIFLISFNSLLS